MNGEARIIKEIMDQWTIREGVIALATKSFRRAVRECEEIAYEQDACASNDIRAEFPAAFEDQP